MDPVLENDVENSYGTADSMLDGGDAKYTKC